MNRQTESKIQSEPDIVLETARHIGEANAMYAWVEQSVWTVPMLMALIKGVKGGRWYSLRDKVGKEENLRAAARAVIRNGGGAGVDGQTTEQFEARLEEEIQRLGRELREGTYEPRPVKRVWIPKLGSKEMRPLGIPSVRDRIVQAALLNVIEPIFEREFAGHSYGFRPGKGAGQALARVERLLTEGYCWIVDVDLKGYFDTINHEKLMKLLEERISDRGILELVWQFLKQGVREGMTGWKPTEQGTPQGAIISPLLSNLYLNALDHMMARKGWQMTRYADDFVVQGRSQEEAQTALALIQEWVEAMELKLHPTKTRIVDAREKGGFDFLGYHFERGMKWPREKSLKKLKDQIREKTGRTEGKSLKEIIQRVNTSLRGWHSYFRGSIPGVMKRADQFVRTRLRAILAYQQRKRKVNGKKVNHLWPNAFFKKQGLFSLAEASEIIHQSQFEIADRRAV